MTHPYYKGLVKIMNDWGISCKEYGKKYNFEDILTSWGRYSRCCPVQLDGEDFFKLCAHLWNTSLSCSLKHCPYLGSFLGKWWGNNWRTGDGQGVVALVEYLEKTAEAYGVYKKF